MPHRPRRYRKKPLAVHKHGTRIYAPTSRLPRYRVVATDVSGRRLFHKFAAEDDARAKAREIDVDRAEHSEPRPELE